jgi:hypothetical protein
MKITVDVECTPEEARTFLGLPDVQPMQEQLLKELQDRLSKNIAAMDPAAMFEQWLPATMKGFEQLQEMFLTQLGRAAKPPGK